VANAATVPAAGPSDGKNTLAKTSADATPYRKKS
jgi:hypothetical protein